MKKKKISLEDLKIQSFATSFEDELAQKFKGGIETALPTPTSGPCVECIYTFLCESTTCEPPQTGTFTTCPNATSKVDTNLLGCCSH